MPLLVVDFGSQIRPAGQDARPNPPSKARRLGATLALVALGIAAWVSPRTAAGQTVTLRPSAHAAHDTPLTVGDIADVTGEGSAAVAAVPLGRARANDAIDAARVREALNQATGINMARIVVRGPACTISDPAAQATQTPAKAAPTPTLISAIPTPGTLRALIPDRLAATLDLDPSDLRLAYDDGDARLLNTPIEGRTVVLRPTGSGERLPVAVRIYDGERLAESGTLRVGVLVRRSVYRVTSAVARGETLIADALKREEAWLPPGVRPAGEAAIGQVVRTRLEPGEVLTADHVELPIVVRRGDLVAVDCISGGFVVQTTARALEAGREGQVIEMQALNSKNTFRGRVSRAGQAVLRLDRDPGATP